MQPVAEVLHAWELLVDGNCTVGIAFLGFPTVVDVHIAVAIICQAFLDECLSAADDLVLGDAQSPAVPAVPAHGRCQANLAAAADGELLLLLALGILCLDGKGVGTWLLERAAESSIVGIARFCRSGGRQDVLRDVLCRGAQACLAFCEGRDNAHHLVAVIGKADAAALGLVDTDLHCLFAQHLARFGVFHLDREDAAFRRLHFADKCADTLTAFTLLDVNAEVIDGIGNADTYGACEHTTRVACIIATDCNHIVRIPLDEAAICLDAIDALGVPIAVVAVRVFGEGTGLANEDAVNFQASFLSLGVDSAPDKEAYLKRLENFAKPTREMFMHGERIYCDFETAKTNIKNRPKKFI